jgi:hypothetical protein
LPISVLKFFWFFNYLNAYWTSLSRGKALKFPLTLPVEKMEEMMVTIHSGLFNFHAKDFNMVNKWYVGSHNQSMYKWIMKLYETIFTDKEEETAVFLDMGTDYMLWLECIDCCAIISRWTIKMAD